jgi:nitroreductase
VLDLLKKRRSTRKFKETKIPGDIIDKLIKAALLSPSSRSIRPWEFIVVTDKIMLEKLAGSKEHSSSFLKHAPLAIIVMADETKSDVWVEDTSIASIIIQLTAETMGLGSCWIQIRNRMHNSTLTAEKYIKELLAIPDNYKIESIIALGYPDENKPPYSEEELKYDVVHMDKYGSQYKY